jgi:hypothetical protein
MSRQGTEIEISHTTISCLFEISRCIQSAYDYFPILYNLDGHVTVKRRKLCNYSICSSREYLQQKIYVNKLALNKNGNTPCSQSYK